jgi:lipid A 3-O-deacylase
MYWRNSAASFALSELETLLVTRILATLLLTVIALAPAARSQSGPESGGHDLQIWTGGGHGLNGSASDTGIWNAGLRYGWVITDPVGPGPLRGRFEYAVDVVPVFLVVQSPNNAYGFGLNPFALKWNFVTRHNIAPYIDIGGGTLFTTEQAPPGTSRINFTTSGAIGAHFLRSKYNWSAEVRFMHISNAGLSTPNPGINTLQVRIGFGRFTRP